MATAIIDLKTVVLSACLIVAVEAGLVWALNPDTVHPVAILGMARCMEIMLLLALVRLSNPKGLAALGLKTKSIVPGLKKGLIWSAGFGFLVALVFGMLFLLTGSNPFDLIHAGLPGTPGAICLFFLIGGIVSPVAEEIVFRGLLYGYLRRWGVWVATPVSTLLFVIAHSTGGQVPLPQIIGGFVFALAYEREKNLLVPMVIHILGNLAIFSVALF